MPKTPEEERISQDLKELFSLQIDGFSDPIIWVNEIGITLVEEGFKKDHVSQYKFGIWDTEMRTYSPSKSLYVSVSYGEKTSGGIKLSDQKKLSDPIDLDFREDFFYNIYSKHIWYREKPISPSDLIKTVRELHKKPTQKFFGLNLRSKLWFWRRSLPFLLTRFDGLLLFLLWIISGEKIDENLWKRIIESKEAERGSDPIPKPEFEKSDTLKFFGYEAKRWSVIFYCVVHLVGFVIYDQTQIKMAQMRIVMENNFLSLCYAITSFALIEKGIPEFLKTLIRETSPGIYGRIVFKKLKIS